MDGVTHRVGFATRDITVFEPDMAMLGWSMPFNRIDGVAAPLKARAMVVSEPGEDSETTSLAYVCCDLLFVSEIVREHVLARVRAERPTLGLDAARVALTATHTHSGPSGFSSYFWKSLGAPGFSRIVFDGIVAGIVGAILDAADARVAGRLHVIADELPASDGIAFNRSWHAYNQNPDVEPVTRDTRDEALDRRMTVLRADDADGQPVGALVWFALHGTCVHADNRLMHPDHKGLAAEHLERSGDGAPPVVIMAQEAAGDVTPNHRYDPERGCNIGRYDDDFRSADWVAGLEARHARRLFDAAPTGGTALGPGLDAAVVHRDFGAVRIDPEVVPEAAGRRTRRAVIGVGMARGTAEGPGPLGPLPWVPRVLNGMRRRADRLRTRLRRGSDERDVDAMFPLLDLDRGTRGRLLGVIPLSEHTLPPVDQVIAYTRGVLRDGLVGRDEPLMPRVLPMQVWRLGGLAIATTSFEVTTVSGRRLRATLRAVLERAGWDVDHTVINPYANGYSGYLTTREEYAVQAYEGSYTLFGPWSLAGVQTVLAEAALELGRPPEQRRPGRPPAHLDLETAARRGFDVRWQGETMRYTGGYRE